MPLRKVALLLLIILSSLFFSFNSFSQRPYYDALILRNQLNQNLLWTDADEEVDSILKTYLIEDQRIKSDIKPSDKNPFLQPYLKAWNSSSGGAVKNFRSLASSIGGLDVTNFADGLAKLIVSRTKEELNSYFFDRFKEEVAKNVELRILFPETSQLLKTIGVKVYNYNAYLLGLREAFEHDLSKIFVSFPKLLDDPKYAKTFDQFPQLRVIVKSSFYVINQLNNKVHPGEVLHNFPNRFGKDTMPGVIYSSVRVTDIFSQSLRTGNASRYWVGLDSIALLADTTTFRIYLGLIYQKMVKDKEEIKFTFNKDTLSFKEGVLKKIGENYSKALVMVSAYQTFVMDLASDADRINTSLKALNSLSDNEEPKYVAIYTFLDASLDLLEDSKKVMELPVIVDFVKTHQAAEKGMEVYDKYLQVGRNANNLYYNLSKRAYGTSVSDLWTILNEIFTPEFKEQSIDMAKSDFASRKSALDGTYQNKKKDKAYNVSLDSLEEIRDSYNYAFIPYVLKYGSFMAAIVTAESSDEVKSIIESAALPAGSSRIKRESQFNVSVNSYLGIFAGKEVIAGVNNKNLINNFSLSAPVGVSFSFGGFRSDKNQPGMSLGGFFSLIDLGAVASFRFGDDSTASIPEIQLKNIIAPGFFLSVGFPKAPISLNIGGQYGPLLREVTATQHRNLENGYWRFGASLVVDIPLFNLYNREKNYKSNE